MTAAHPLKAFRESQSPPLTQRELAMKLGVSRNTVNRWELGLRHPKRAQAKELAKVTGISAAELIGVGEAAE